MKKILGDSLMERPSNPIVQAQVNRGRVKLYNDVTHQFASDLVPEIQKTRQRNLQRIVQNTKSIMQQILRMRKEAQMHRKFNTEFDNWLQYAPEIAEMKLDVLKFRILFDFYHQFLGKMQIRGLQQIRKVEKSSNRLALLKKVYLQRQSVTDQMIVRLMKKHLPQQSQKLVELSINRLRQKANILIPVQPEKMKKKYTGGYLQPVKVYEIDVNSDFDQSSSIIRSSIATSTNSGRTRSIQRGLETLQWTQPLGQKQDANLSVDYYGSYSNEDQNSDFMRNPRKLGFTIGNTPSNNNSESILSMVNAESGKIVPEKLNELISPEFSKQKKNNLFPSNKFRNYSMEFIQQQQVSEQYKAEIPLIEELNNSTYDFNETIEDQITFSILREVKEEINQISSNNKRRRTEISQRTLKFNSFQLFFNQCFNIFQQNIEQQIDCLDFNSVNTTPTLLRVVNAVNKISADDLNSSSMVLQRKKGNSGLEDIDQSQREDYTQEDLEEESEANLLQNHLEKGFEKLNGPSYLIDKNSKSNDINKGQFISFREFKKLNPVQIFIILSKNQELLGRFLSQIQHQKRVIFQMAGFNQKHF